MISRCKIGRRRKRDSMMTVFISRTKRAFATARVQAPLIGWPWVIADRILRRLGFKEIQLKAKGMGHRVACRVGTADIFEYAQSLGRGQVPLDLPIRPEIIVDAGANVGYSALRFQKEFPGVMIIALEPEQDNFTQLKKNCAPYSNIIIERKALWATNTRLRIRVPDADVNGFQVKEDPDGDIEALSMDEVMKRHRLSRIDLLKIDIEGSEKVVFSH